MIQSKKIPLGIKLAVVSTILLCTSNIYTSHAQTFKVKRIIDGDTIELINGEKVRYIGIDTPERDQEFYLKAKEANKKLVTGKKLRLEFDVQKRDRYGRLLAYVHMANTFVNAELIRLGYANVYTVPPNVRYQETFLALQKEAREAKRGLWSIQTKSDEPYYLASRNGKKFHRPACKWAKKISPKNLIKFKTRDEAIDKGYSPCRSCGP